MNTQTYSNRAAKIAQEKWPELNEDTLHEWKRYRRRTQKLRKKMAYLLGDMIFYINQKAKECGYTIEEILDMNIEKLEKEQR